MELFHIGQNRLQDHGVFRRSDQAVRDRNNAVRPAGVEAGHRLAVFHADRELGFIAEPVRIFHTDDRLQNAVCQCFIKAADPDQAAAHLFVLEQELLIVPQRLQLAAAARARNLTTRANTVRRRAQHFQKLRVSEVFPGLHDFGADIVSDHGILDKKCVAVRLADAFAVAPQICNGKLRDVILLKWYFRGLPVRTARSRH